MSQDVDICGWARQSEIQHRYHDDEWGLLRTDDRTLFEFMVLESAQAGLSWRTVLNPVVCPLLRHVRVLDPPLAAPQVRRSWRFYSLFFLNSCILSSPRWWW